MRGVYAKNSVYEHVTGWRDFEPTLTRAEKMSADDLFATTHALPDEWWKENENDDSLNRLLDVLYARREQIPDLIIAFRRSSRYPFPNWPIS